VTFADPPPGLHANADHGDGKGQPGLVEQALQGRPAGDLTQDDILDNITLYWLTITGVSSARLYRENKADFFNGKNISIPFAISVFPDELYQAPQAGPRRPLRGRGTTATLLGRDGRQLQAAAQVTSIGAATPPQCRP
jgi:hypothetical protein